MTEDVDTVSEDLGFLNIHYYAAAATQYGGLVHGGYEYDGMMYDIDFRHVEEYDQCYECHDMHTLELKLDECATCHEGVVTTEDLKDIRMDGSLADYDGDGDTEEGVYYEIDGLKEMLYTAIQEYGEEVAGTPIVYNSSSYPYWFDDKAVDSASWTARLLKAAYNYQVAVKDPGEHAHNGKYIIQLLHDSINDLNEAITNQVDMSMAHRIDPGHFAGSKEAWRHWDEDDYEVSGSCSKCHSADGIPFLHEEGVSITQEAANGMMCSTCHNGAGMASIVGNLTKSCSPMALKSASRRAAAWTITSVSSAIRVAPTEASLTTIAKVLVMMRLHRVPDSATSTTSLPAPPCSAMSPTASTSSRAKLT